MVPLPGLNLNPTGTNNQSVKVISTAALQPAGLNFTVSGWFSFQSFNQTQVLFTKGGQNAPTWIVQMTTGSSGPQLSMNFYDSSGGHPSSAANFTPTPGAFQHIALTYSQGSSGMPSTATLYVNGNAIITQTINSFTLNYDGGPLVIGGQLQSDGVTVVNALCAIVYDVRFYNIALPASSGAATIGQVYNSACPLFTDPTVSPLSNLGAWWKLDESSGTTAHDATARGSNPGSPGTVLVSTGAQPSWSLPGPADPRELILTPGQINPNTLTPSSGKFTLSGTCVPPFLYNEMTAFYNNGTGLTFGSVSSSQQGQWSISFNAPSSTTTIVVSIYASHPQGDISLNVPINIGVGTELEKAKSRH